jgi:ABC-type glycerol-3-phosphate transport system permease component
MTAYAVKPGRSGLVYAIALLMAAIFITPLIVAILTSLKSPQEITRVLSIPATPYFHNFSVAFQRMGRSFLNSISITAPAVFLSIGIGAIAGYPLAYMGTRYGRLIYFILLSGMLVPFQIVQIPLFFMIRSIGLYDTIPGMWLAHTAYAVPFCTFFMRNFFASVPRSMYEAALIEGLRTLRLFLSPAFACLKVRPGCAGNHPEPRNLE